jgi:sulfur-carrier protein
MNVRVRLFAIARERAGCDVVTVAWPEGATIGACRAALGVHCAALGAALRHMLSAIAADYADDATPIPPDAEIACIPPVSGG